VSCDCCDRRSRDWWASGVLASAKSIASSNWHTAAYLPRSRGLVAQAGPAREDFCCGLDDVRHTPVGIPDQNARVSICAMTGRRAPPRLECNVSATPEN